MAWTKDLGNVKGEKGDIYIPQITIVNKKMHITWTKQESTNIEAPTDFEIPIPIYIPQQSEIDKLKGNIVFSVSEEVRQQYGANAFPPLEVHVKGEAGGVIASFATETFSGNIETYEFDNSSIENVENHHPNAHTFYINETNNEVWIYTNNKFIQLEGMTLDNYYAKSETYNKDEIDEKIGTIQEQTDIINQLLSISTFTVDDDTNTEDEGT